jgi:hypothetical protein
MKSTLPYLAATLIVVASGVVQGLRTDRWAVSHELRDAVARIDLVPMSFGDWAGQPTEIDRRQLEAADIAGGMTRRYVNRRDGRALDVLLVCGRPGPISVHTPDICYTGAGYVLRDGQVQAPLTYGTPPRIAEAWRGDFVKQNSVVPSCLRIYWSWSAGDGWKNPDNPRLVFAGHKFLYKVYVIRETSGPAGPAEDDPGGDFLKDFLPELDRVLGPPPAR